MEILCGNLSTLKPFLHVNKETAHNSIFRIKCGKAYTNKANFRCTVDKNALFDVEVEPRILFYLVELSPHLMLFFPSKTTNDLIL